MYNENCVTSQHIKKGYQEITFEQFKKYILNEDMEDKKVDYYKLIKPEFSKAAEAIMEINLGYEADEGVVRVPSCIEKLEKAGVLNLWFEPVYKSRPPQIEINGYKGEFFDSHVIFGCASISKEIFENLYTAREYKNTNRDIESVTIGKGVFSKEVIKQIAEYYIRRNES